MRRNRYSPSLLIADMLLSSFYQDTVVNLLKFCLSDNFNVQNFKKNFGRLNHLKWDMKHVKVGTLKSIESFITKNLHKNVSMIRKYKNLLIKNI